jgi:hypothetical protein
MSLAGTLLSCLALPSLAITLRETDQPRQSMPALACPALPMRDLHRFAFQIQAKPALHRHDLTSNIVLRHSLSLPARLCRFAGFHIVQAGLKLPLRLLDKITDIGHFTISALEGLKIPLSLPKDRKLQFKTGLHIAD